MLKKTKKIIQKTSSKKKPVISTKKEFRSKYFRKVEDLDSATFVSYFRFKKDRYWIIDTITDKLLPSINNINIRCKNYKYKTMTQVIKSFGLETENSSHEEWNDIVGESIHFILESSSMFKIFE